jgi:uncharacterized protein
VTSQPSSAPAIRTLLVTGGHAFARAPFLRTWQAYLGFEVRHVEHPEATEWLTSGRAQEYDAIVFYDMPGVDPRGPVMPETPASVVAAFERLTAAGTGLVFLHHALASWPAWPGYAEMVGGRYHFWPGTLRGQQWPDSGYLHDATHTVSVVASTHPVCAGIPAQFTLTDELYLAPVLTDSITPLLRSDFEFVTENFWSTGCAMRGNRYDRTGWHHPPGSDLVGWTRQQDRSRIVYLEPGDGPSAYRNQWVRRLWHNAVRWVSNRSVS